MNVWHPSAGESGGGKRPPAGTRPSGESKESIMVNIFSSGKSAQFNKFIAFIPVRANSSDIKFPNYNFMYLF